MIGNIHCDFDAVSWIDELREQIKEGTLTGVSSNGTHAVIHYDTNKQKVQSADTNQHELHGSSEWNGEGLPPVGYECAFNANGGDNYNKCVINFIGNKYIVFTDNYGEWSYTFNKVKFKKLLTPEQKQQKIDEQNGELFYGIILLARGDDIKLNTLGYSLVSDVTKKEYIEIAKLVSFKGKLENI